MQAADFAWSRCGGFANLATYSPLRRFPGEFFQYTASSPITNEGGDNIGDKSVSAQVTERETPLFPLITEESVRITYTKLNTYSQCALRYRYAYIERLPRPPFTTMAFATRLHKVLKQFHGQGKTDGIVDEAKLLQTLETVWEEAQCGKSKKSGYADGVDILKSYAKRQSELGRVPVMVERPMKTAFGPYILEGKIDRVDFASEGTFRIVDYKLDKTLPADDAAEKSRQLSFYAILAHEKEGLEVSEVSLYYLRHGRELIAKRTDAQLRETVEWIDATATAIPKEKDWQPTEGKGCGTCPFKDVCPAKTGKKRELQGKWTQFGMFDVQEEE